jgi:hypothetical protein
MHKIQDLTQNRYKKRLFLTHFLIKCGMGGFYHPNDLIKVILLIHMNIKKGDDPAYTRHHKEVEVY